MLKWFTRRRREAPREEAPQLTQSTRRALEYPGSSGPISYATLDRMERDAMVQTALTIKRLTVMSGTWRVARSSDSADARRNEAFVREAFERMEGSPLTILNGAMDAFAKGWSAQEMVYEESGGRIWLRASRPKDPSLFGLEIDAYGRVGGLVLRLPGEAERTLPSEKFVLYVHRGGYGRPKGRSDLEAAYPHWQAKERLLAAWRFHLERFASPTVLGRFARGLPSDEQSALLGALQRLSDSTAILYPSEIEIDTLGGDREASAGFQEAIEYHNREIARAILGQTLTTDEGRRVGSLALGKVHLQVLLLQAEAIRRELADVVMTEQVIRPLVEMNFGPGSIPRFEFERVELEVFRSGRL
jgi:phage gp29-like protein